MPSKSYHPPLKLMIPAVVVLTAGVGAALLVRPLHIVAYTLLLLLPIIYILYDQESPEPSL
jgi:hypothetical protein